MIWKAVGLSVCGPGGHRLIQKVGRALKAEEEEGEEDGEGGEEKRKRAKVFMWLDLGQVRYEWSKWASSHPSI